MPDSLTRAQFALQALVAPIGGEVRQYSPLLTVIGTAKKAK